MDNFLITILFACVGLLFIGISLPLIKGRVPPNHIYGFRTRKTLSNERIWYEANRVSGYDLFIAGVLITFASLTMFVFARSWNPDQFTLTILTVMLLSLAGAVAHSFQALRQM